LKVITAMHQQPRAQSARSAELGDLDTLWGDLYDLAVTRDGWVAKRLDNNRPLLAETPTELHRKIEADYNAQPIPREAVTEEDS
jgi:hypothetical protein